MAKVFESSQVSSKLANPQANHLDLVQTNLAEFKAQEIAKLQNSLQEMKIKVDETNALLLMERENAKKAIEVTSPVIKEAMVLVEDKEKIKRLRMEVDYLKVKLDILIC